MSEGPSTSTASNSVVAAAPVPIPLPEAVTAPGIFSLEDRLLLPHGETGELYAKHSEGDVNFFAVVVSTGDLLLVCDHSWPFDGSKKGWTVKHIPWYSDPVKKISALTFDDEGLLFLGTWDGTVYELRTRKALASSATLAETDLLEICHLNSIRVQYIVVYNQDTNKIILCSGDNGKFVILTNHTPPVLVTFTSCILGVELFANKAGLTCALVCLESGQNVFCVLDDLDFPSTPESQGKRSLFKKAKDNLMSRLSEEKLGFFSKKSHKEASPSPTGSQNNVAQNVLSTTTVAAPSVIVGHVGSQKPGSIPLNNVKFQTIDEVSCKGLIKKVVRQNYFYRQGSNKIDIFDGEFRQITATYVPNSMASVFAIQKLYFAVDEENQLLRVAIIIDSVFREFSTISFPHKILAVEPFGEEGTPYRVFIIAENGIYELSLKKSPLETCVDLMLAEVGSNIVDAVCSALNVPKTQVCVLAGDQRSVEGKFSKTIIYYKLAGLSYAEICARFGSRGQTAAMLFFFELVDQERTKFAGTIQERQTMTDLALIGRIEQFLRQGLVRSDLPKSPEMQLRKMLISNVHYSAAKASQNLAMPELIWALRIVGKCRQCYPDILSSLHENESTVTPPYHFKKIFWNLLTTDWLAIYTADPTVFVWFRALVWKYMKRVNTPVLMKVLRVLLPWRRELQRKIFTEVSDLVNIIDFTVSPDIQRVVVDDYVSLFLVLLIEAVRRNEKTVLRLPEYVYKADARIYLKREIVNHKNNMVATMMLSYTFIKPFSASGNHCVCVRNGRVYSWGENKLGRLGLGEQRGRVITDSPTPITLPVSLRLHIESVCAGQSHTLALTSAGTILVWGSNSHGQLGLGKDTVWTGRPVPLNIPHVIFTCIAAGSFHSVAIDHLNRVWAWGWGVWGQLGNGNVENIFTPTLVDITEKIVFVSAGHSHTGFLTCFGKVLICGCNHFGQLGIGKKEGKVKVPTPINTLPTGTLIRLIECGICATVLVTTKNRLFYAGLNPASLKSLLNNAKKKDRSHQPDKNDDDTKDFIEPTPIDASHMAGDITRVSASSTHFGIMTSLGYCYTWGIGKSGQLGRNDDDSKNLELIDCDNKMIVASDICCAGDCTFVVERDTGNVFGCGFNSSGQIGKMESEDEHSVMTVRTKKRVVKIRQPANIYFRLKEIQGLPKQVSWDGENSVISSHKIAPHTNIVGQELLEWCLNVFRRNYDAKFMTARCIEAGNLPAASLLETLAENHEQALRHNLDAAGGNQKEVDAAIEAYIDAVGEKSPTLEQACRFLFLVIQHWSKHSLNSSDLENLLDRHRKNPKWGSLLNQAIRECVAAGDDSATWIASNLTPVFILSAIKGIPTPPNPSTAPNNAKTPTEKNKESPLNQDVPTTSTVHPDENESNNDSKPANGDAKINGV